MCANIRKNGKEVTLPTLMTPNEKTAKSHKGQKGRMFLGYYNYLYLKLILPTVVVKNPTVAFFIPTIGILFNAMRLHHRYLYFSTRASLMIPCQLRPKAKS